MFACESLFVATRPMEHEVTHRLDAGDSTRAIRTALTAGQRYPVAVLAADDMERLGTTSQTVWLSDDTLAKQFANRQGQDVTLDDYWRVQQVLEQPSLILAERDYHLKFVKQQDKWWAAVVKVTRDGKENWLQSFFPTNEKEVRRLKRNGKVLWEKE